MEENNSQPNKYNAALAKYNTNLSDADIQARVAELIEKKVPENNTEDVKKFLFNCIDLTTLNSTDSDKSVMHFTEKSISLTTNILILKMLQQSVYTPILQPSLRIRWR